ncbi:MAG: RHS repeat-associated core domain-containing protein [Chloroflexi bacterium]|nr:RHS repeat-associated core domain-containing protein [Chloroflexota bacterium]
MGNRLTKNTTSYTYDNGDRMTAAGGVSYTCYNNGNQTASGSDTFSWDYENRLTRATVSGSSATYAYRGDSLRHSKTVSGNTTTYTWDVNSSLPVILQDGTFTYVYGHGLISQTDSAGVQSYFLGNGLESTEALTDGSGNVIATYKYDVFGAVISSSGSGSSEYTFTGQQDDATLGYTYLRARYYDPAIGRFVSKDALPLINRYTYVENNVNSIDPTGLFCEKSNKLA